MSRFRFRWNILFAVIFLVALAAAAYLTWQLRRSAPAAPAGFLAAKKGYGVTIDLTRYNEEELAAVLVSLQENGLVWLRQPVTWADIETRPGQFNWQPLDRAVNQVESLSGEVELIASLQTSPAWARPAKTPAMTPPVEVSDFGRFARAFAARYGRRVDYYQIWHEPNLSANWGNVFVDPAAYADLLREAALNIHAADPTAFILTAGLAPTLENGPLNVNEVTYLDRLYQARASDWFDIVAGQAYGFDARPSAPPAVDALNFRRAELLRQVMLAHGDAETPIWATAFGWNALPSDWRGRPSPWHSEPPPVQAERTAAAIDYARRQWPWLGPMLAVRWDAAGLAEDEPARGFALLNTPPVLQAIREAATAEPAATVGLYPADHSSGRYSSDWRFALSRADAPRQEPRTLTLPFEGTRLDLLVNRGPYRGYLWITVDGQPAGALPRDSQGRSYVVLYDPLRESQAVTVARYLPAGPHRAVIKAGGGWGQWALSGWAVYREADQRLRYIGLVIAGVLAVASGAALLATFFRSGGEALARLWAWSEVGVALYAVLGRRGQGLMTFVLALGFFLAPGPLALALLLPLAGAILLRPDLGLALTAFSLSFFLALKQLPGRAVSPVELALALTAIGFVFRGLLALGRKQYVLPGPDSRRSDAKPNTAGLLSQNIPNHISQIPNLRGRYPKFPVFFPEAWRPADWAALVLAVLALLATLAAENFGVSMREWRVVVLESVLFYFLVRQGKDFSPPGPDFLFEEPVSAGKRDEETWRWAWRLVDAFVAGAALQALIALFLYFFTDQSITAEGVRRALGLAYGSPNNLSLFLDRAWPILLAVAFFPGPHQSSARPLRRRLYGAGLIPISAALYLTFSKGALLLGLPAGLAAMALLYVYRNRQHRRRQALVTALGGLMVIGLALFPLSRTERFRTLFDFGQGSTGFFRLKLWQASLAMLRDHWPLGVGLDNFLYQYRTRYILPEAWQEPNLSHPHNLLLNFGTRLGLGGIAVLLWLQAAFWRNAWRLYQRRPESLVLGLIGSMVIFLAHGLVDNAYFLTDLAFTFFLTVGIVQRLSEQADS